MKENRNIWKSVFYVGCLCVMTFGSVMSQVKDKEKEKIQKEALELLSDASLEIQKDNFPRAEAEYRKAIALNPVDETGKYNLGNAYYNKQKNSEAMGRFKQAASIATTKGEKHKAFHNLGNTFMNDAKYQEAVDAYKNALRNNPTDDETRYNLALAKDMLEKNPPQGGGGDDDKEEEDKDKKENEEKKDEGDNEEEGDKGDQKENEDKGDEKEDKKEGDNEKDKGEPKDQKEDDQPQQQQPVPGKLSPQQVKNLLEAMNNEEKKVQDKINAQKQKGAKVKSKKDW